MQGMLDAMLAIARNHVDDGSSSCTQRAATMQDAAAMRDVPDTM
jgi:hypothetical protein